jgi:hypothetical protein
MHKGMNSNAVSHTYNANGLGCRAMSRRTLIPMAAGMQHGNIDHGKNDLVYSRFAIESAVSFRFALGTMDDG